ncbi:type 1 glutamine amidotransferase domain-containing protein [Methanoculleus sp.]|uniref:type 1 glutamine amidotransferase domain-containing protein n=1 Tax=Methanoculleus sp. TaxID=90427 RepID=UPI001BD6269F|nr:type 1 glutamine amidotransferase domain-containing protein [Methanoculleus sp.]
MSRIAVLITDMFEDVEYTKPAEAFREAGHDLVHIGLSAGETVHGKKEQTPVKIDRAASDVSADDFDALFIPGGYSPDKLRAHDAPVEFVRRFVESGKPVLAICHAPQLLITAQVLEGRKITGWKSVIQDIKNAGAEYIDREVAIDGNLVSSRNPDDIPAFIEASLAKLKEPVGRKAEAAER